MRKTVLIALFAATFAIAAQAQAKCTDVTDAQSGIRMCFPAGWKPNVRPVDSRDTVFVVGLNDRVNGDVMMFVLLKKTTADDPDDLEAMMRNAIKSERARNAPDGTEDLGSTPFKTASGLEGTKSTFRRSYQQIPYRHLFYRFEIDGRNISVLTIHENSKPKVEQTSDELVKSLKAPGSTPK